MTGMVIYCRITPIAVKNRVHKIRLNPVRKKSRLIYSIFCFLSICLYLSHFSSAAGFSGLWKINMHAELAPIEADARAARPNIFNPIDCFEVFCERDPAGRAGDRIPL
jgi:hypothetical protein